MAAAKDLFEKSDFNVEELINNINQVINGKKQIKTSEENIKALKEAYEEYLDESFILVDKANKKEKAAIWNIEDFEDKIRDVKNYEKKSYLEDIEKDIEIVEKFLDKKGKFQDEDHRLKLNSLIFQAKAILEIENALEEIEDENIIEESTKKAIELQIKNNIFSEDLKDYYLEKINKITYDSETEKIAEELEEELEEEKEFDPETVENKELNVDDFEEEDEFSRKKPKLFRFVKMPVETVRKIKRGDLGKIARAFEKIYELESKMNDKNITSSEIESEIYEIEKLLKKKKAILKSNKDDKASALKMVENLKQRLEKIKEREAQEEKEKELKEKNKNNIEQYNQILANFKNKPNKNNYQVVLGKIELNKNNKDIFENEEAYNEKVEEVTNLHNEYVEKIKSGINLLVEAIKSTPTLVNIDAFNKKASKIKIDDYEITLEEAFKELAKEDIEEYFNQVHDIFIEYIESNIENIMSFDTDKAKEIYVQNLKKQLNSRKNYFKSEEELNLYLDKIEKSKSISNSNNLEKELMDKYNVLASSPDVEGKQIIKLHKEISANEDKLNKDFVKDLRIKLDNLVIDFFENIIEFIEDFELVNPEEEIEKTKGIVNTYINDYASNESVGSFKEIINKLNQIMDSFNKTNFIDDIKTKLDNLSLNPTYAGIKALDDELEINKDNSTEEFSRNISEKLTVLYENLVNKDFKQIETSPSVQSIENLLDNMNLVNLYFPNSFEIKEKLNQMKEKLNNKHSEEQIIKEILNDVEKAMNAARNNPTKENIEKAREEINKYKHNSDIFSNNSLKRNNKADAYLQELDNLSKTAFNENIYGSENNFEQYDRIINSKISSLDDLYEKLGKIEYDMHMLEGQFIAPEQKENRLRILNAQKNKIELELAKVKEQVEKYEKLKEEKRSQNNYYDKLFEGVSHLTDEQLAAGVKQNMSYEELAEISRNLEKAEKLTQSNPEPTISKEDISDSAYENITKSISSALQTRLNNPELAKELIEKANSIFNQNYYVYSESQREQLNEYLQTATNMIDEEIYKNSGSVLK